MSLLVIVVLHEAGYALPDKRKEKSKNITIDRPLLRKKLGIINPSTD